MLVERSKKQTLAVARNTSFQRFIDYKLSCAAAATKNENAHCEEGEVVQTSRECTHNYQGAEWMKGQFWDCSREDGDIAEL